MAVQRLDAEAAIERLTSFDAVIDARSEGEFAEDRLPGAVNWPSLTDAERAEVGTVYAQVSPFEARKRGAVVVARNIARHVEREAAALPRTWSPLVYCWRGGQRSAALATVLDAIGFRTSACSKAGYREFRRAVLREPSTPARALTYRVLCGRHRQRQEPPARRTGRARCPGARPRGAGLPPRQRARRCLGSRSLRRARSRRRGRGCALTRRSRLGPRARAARSAACACPRRCSSGCAPHRARPSRCHSPRAWCC
ncbi:MAG: rhodanese-like domain-containing protein [Rubrivivax sp.]